MRIYTDAKKGDETMRVEVHADKFHAGLAELKAKLPEGWQIQAIEVDPDEPVGGQS
ncbi:hypothetical protein AB4Y63_17705 [Leifsonia sp. YAF41]|uniref:hypothetical protein n=1 Tax=Leifsonia sp. YAF41 TaxID=3233086 RepID=UPI003F956C35